MLQPLPRHINYRITFETLGTFLQDYVEKLKMDSNTGPLDKQAVVVYLYLRCIMPTGTNIEIPATQIHI